MSKTQYVPPPVDPTGYGVGIARNLIAMAEKTEIENVPAKWALDMAHALVELAAEVEMCAWPQD